jgi:hypothetical protein
VEARAGEAGAGNESLSLPALEEDTLIPILI